MRGQLINRRMETVFIGIILLFISTTISGTIGLQMGDTLHLTCPAKGKTSLNLTWSRSEDKDVDKVIGLEKTNKPTSYFVMPPNLSEYLDTMTKENSVNQEFINVTKDFNNLAKEVNNVTKEFDNVSRRVKEAYKDWFYSMESNVFLTANHIHVAQICDGMSDGPNKTNDSENSDKLVNETNDSDKLVNKTNDSDQLVNKSAERECINSTCKVNYLRCNSKGEACITGVLECKMEVIEEICEQQEDNTILEPVKRRQNIRKNASDATLQLQPTISPVPPSQPQMVTILTAALLVTLLLGACIVLVVIRRLRKEKSKSAMVVQWTKKIIIESQTSPGEDGHLKMPLVKIERQRKVSRTLNASEDIPMTEYELPPDSVWEFPRHALTLGKTLGEGEFGKVVRAEARDILSPGTSTTVAIKMLKEDHSDAEVIDLVSEMELMKMIGKHINIINLLGVCTQDGSPYVIVEYAKHNNLLHFLRKHAPSSLYRNQNQHVLCEKDLISFSLQVAKGMQYLHSKKCIHRDLAARNVLVSVNRVMKIADFGLARDVRSRDYYRKKTTGKLPIKWMAPEAVFNSLYTYASDVWSYGVLLWEIMTFGEAPYPTVVNLDTFLALLRNGHTMERPDGCPENMYTIMRRCWNYDASKRPQFREVVMEMDNILNENTFMGSKMITNALYVEQDCIQPHGL